MHTVDLAVTHRLGFLVCKEKKEVVCPCKELTKVRNITQNHCTTKQSTNNGNQPLMAISMAATPNDNSKKQQ
jgi:hypothetical protein